MTIPQARPDIPNLWRIKDITGNKYNMLTALELVDVVKGNARWKFQCDCGKVIIKLACNIKPLKTYSCGCYGRELHAKLVSGVAKKYLTTHGMHGTKAYKSWASMKRRCLPGYHESHLYYDRGIGACERWLDKKQGFVNFFADMGEPPTAKHSIDRIDVNKGYEPSNCRWATPKEQGRNKRNNHLVEYKGKMMTIADVADATGIQYGTLWWRINKSTGKCAGRFE